MVSDRKSPLFRGIILLLLGAMLLGLTGCEKTKEEKTLCLGSAGIRYEKKQPGRRSSAVRRRRAEKRHPNRSAFYLWSRVRESNPPLWLGKRPFYR